MQTTTARPSRNARLEFGRVALVGVAMLIGSLAMTAGRAQTAAPAAAPPTQDAAAKRDRLLVFSKTAGFRHQSIPDGIKALREILGGRYEIDASEDSAVFTADNLKRYRAVVFLSTTGDILNDEQQKAFEGYIRAGGGYAGVHAAADTEHTWPWYGDLVGAYFKTHPEIQPATIKVEDRTHRSTRMLPAEWRRTDEWYVYNRNPRGRVRVLASLDDSTIKGATMDGDHPIAWFHEFQGGRSWYTGGGHTSESFTEDLFRKHLEGGILWAAGAADDAPGTAPPVAR
jgi:type 1 glutamine amidotransferase